MKKLISSKLFKTIFITLIIDNIFFHLYGCQKEILETISKNDIENMIIPKLQIWLEQLTGINKKIPKHCMLIVEIDSGRLKFHELGK